MSTEADQPRDSSITFVNGQRIRIRPPAPEPDYEDVEENPSPKKYQTNDSFSFTAANVAKSSRSKPNRVAPDPPPISPQGKEADRNSPFKSILKKSSRSSDSKMLTYSGRSKAGSHFYLPLPNSSRKKVQFLVEHCGNGDEMNENGEEISPDYEDQETTMKESSVNEFENGDSSNSEGSYKFSHFLSQHSYFRYSSSLYVFLEETCIYYLLFIIVNLAKIFFVRIFCPSSFIIILKVYLHLKQNIAK